MLFSSHFRALLLFSSVLSKINQENQRKKKGDKIPLKSLENIKNMRIKERTKKGQKFITKILKLFNNELQKKNLNLEHVKESNNSKLT